MRSPWLIGAGLLLSQASIAAQETGRPFVWPAIGGRELPLPRLALLGAPALRLGTADGPDHTLFHGIVGVVRLSSGEIVIGDSGNNRVLFFDADGSFLRAVGRTGDGPGEFRMPRWLGQCASGALMVHDGMHARATHLTPSGRVALIADLPEINFDRVLWCSGQGRVQILLNRPRGPVTPGEHMDLATLLLLVDGARIDTVARPGPQEYYIAERLSAFMSVPLGKMVLASAGGNVIYACDNISARCTVLDSAGVVMHTFTLPLTRSAAATGDWARAVEEHLALLALGQERRIAVQVLKEVEPATEFPRLDRVQADEEGNLWVRTFDNFRTEFATWIGVSPEGSPIGMLATRRDLHLLRIGRDHLIGFVRDEDEVERVEVHRFVPFP